MSLPDAGVNPAPAAPGSSDRRRTHGFFGHPTQLATLASLEVFERFSFYGMQAVMVYYLARVATEGGLGLGEATASGIIGAYGGLVFLMSIVGGWLADRAFGAERVLFVSAVAVMLGHIALALVPGAAGVLVGLVLVAVGSGGLKTTSSSIVGTLYATTDPRRDAGFNIYYMGVNLGSFFGTALTGLTQDTFAKMGQPLLGFHLAFGLAAVGMAVGLVVYVWRRRALPDSSREVPNPLGSRTPLVVWPIVVLALLALLLGTGLLTLDNVSTWVAAIAGGAAIFYIVMMLRSPRVSAVERSRVVAYIPLFLGAVVFWALFQQQFNTLAFYAQNRTDLEVFGWTMPAAWIQQFNPLFIMLLTPVVVALWNRLGHRQPHGGIKFAMGLVGVGVGYLLFLPMVGSGANGTPLLWVALILLMFTLGELCLSPVGLSMSSKLAPVSYRTQMMALWNLSSALGTALTGPLSQWGAAQSETVGFGAQGVAALVVAGILVVVSPRILRAMQGVR